jgi:hypothetical protein
MRSAAAILAENNATFEDDKIPPMIREAHVGRLYYNVP